MQAYASLRNAEKKLTHFCLRKHGGALLSKFNNFNKKIQKVTLAQICCLYILLLAAASR